MSKPTAADRLEELANWDGGDLVNYVTWGNDELLRNAAELVRVINSLAHCPVCDALQFGIKQGSQQTHFREDCPVAKLQGSDSDDQ